MNKDNLYVEMDEDDKKEKKVRKYGKKDSSKEKSVSLLLWVIILLFSALIIIIVYIKLNEYSITIKKRNSLEKEENVKNQNKLDIEKRIYLLEKENQELKEKLEDIKSKLNETVYEFQIIFQSKIETKIEINIEPPKIDTNDTIEDILEVEIDTYIEFIKKLIILYEDKKEKLELCLEEYKKSLLNNQKIDDKQNEELKDIQFKLDISIEIIDIILNYKRKELKINKKDNKEKYKENFELIAKIIEEIISENKESNDRITSVKNELNKITSKNHYLESENYELRMRIEKIQADINNAKRRNFENSFKEKYKGIQKWPIIISDYVTIMNILHILFYESTEDNVKASVYEYKEKINREGLSPRDGIKMLIKLYQKNNEYNDNNSRYPEYSYLNNYPDSHQMGMESNYDIVPSVLPLEAFPYNNF